MGAKRYLLVELILLLSLVAIGGTSLAQASTLRSYGTDNEDSNTKIRGLRDPDAWAVTDADADANADPARAKIGEDKPKDAEAESQRKLTEHKTGKKTNKNPEPKLHKVKQTRMSTKENPKAANAPKTNANVPREERPKNPEPELRTKKQTRMNAKETPKAAKAQKANANVPHEERPKQHNEEDCPKVKTGSPPACHNGGRCFQVKGKPDTRRCACVKGYKGDKCELKPCPPPAKEGNLVNGRCVEWESKYTCPGCNTFWKLQLTCRDVGKQTSTAEEHCRGLHKPNNELFNRMCRFCSGESRKPSRKASRKSSRKLSSHVGAGGATNETLLEEEFELRGEAKTGGRQDSAPSPHQRRLVRHLPPYTFASGAGIPANTIAYSSSEHLLVPASPHIEDVEDLTMDACFETCFTRAGSNARPIDTMGVEHCTWLLWIPGYTEISKDRRHRFARNSKCRMFSSGIFPEPAANPPASLPNGERTGTLAFVTFPRAFDMFRDSTNPAPNERRTYQVSGPNGDIRYEARFTSHVKAPEGQGTYVIAHGSPQYRPGCVATYDTRLDASKHYERKILKSKSKTTLQPAAFMAAFPTTLPSFGDLNGQSEPQTGRVTSRHSGGNAWNYDFDTLLRVHSVRPADGSIPAKNRGSRDDSPNAFNEKFNFIMRRSIYSSGPGPGDAGHLVAATQRPPNFFFNYVPQNKASNSNGCWYLAEKVARQFMEHQCSITYDAGLTYPTPTEDTPWDRCYAQFRPTRMSLDFRVTGGADYCKAVYDAYQGAALFTATVPPSVNGVSGHITATRLMAYTLHREYTARVEDKNDLSGLLELATTSSAINWCNTDVGNYENFQSLTLSPNFAHATLLNEGASSQSKCFNWVEEDAIKIFSEMSTGSTKTTRQEVYEMEYEPTIRLLAGNPGERERRYVRRHERGQRVSQPHRNGRGKSCCRHCMSTVHLPSQSLFQDRRSATHR